MLNFHIVTLFPEFFDSPLHVGLVARARTKGQISFSFHNPRTFRPWRHPFVDDAPYGGGAGMVMRADAVAAAIRSVGEPGRLLHLTPAGRPFTAAQAQRLAREDNITLICGRYEGIDVRLAQLFPLEDISVGEAVLNGGETAALAVIESVSRFICDFLGNCTSVQEESFANGLLEYPHYTRPEAVEGVLVPPVLLSGHHQRITDWRRQQSLARTMERRPELLNDAPLDRTDAVFLSTRPRPALGRNLCLALLHHPVRLGGGGVGCSSLTNLDIHDIARLSQSYGLGAFFVLTPLEDQLNLLDRILAHWRDRTDTDRHRALALVEPVRNFDELRARILRRYGVQAAFLATSTYWPKKKVPLYTPGEVRSRLQQGPVVICLGTAQGLARDVYGWCDGQLRPLRFLGDTHLSVRSAAAIVVDRILGDFY